MQAVRRSWMLSLLLAAVSSGISPLERPAALQASEIELAMGAGFSPDVAAAGSRRRIDVRHGAKPAWHSRLTSLVAPHGSLRPHFGRKDGDASPRLPNGLNAPLLN